MVQVDHYQYIEHIHHVGQEWLAATIFAVVALICFTLMLRHSHSKALSCLFLTAFLMAVLDFLHGYLAVFGVVEDLAFFIPITWLIGKVLFHFMLLFFNTATRLPSWSYFMIGVVTTCIMIALEYAHAVYYVQGGLIGRPWELIAVCFGIVGVIKELYWRHEYSYFLISAHGVGIITSLVMVFSLVLFDTAFDIAHWLHVGMAISLLVLVLRIIQNISFPSIKNGI